jgi:hypothetical protein
MIVEYVEGKLDVQTRHAFGGTVNIHEKPQSE